MVNRPSGRAGPEAALSRRTLLRWAAGGVAATLGLAGCRGVERAQREARWAGRHLVVVTAGGALRQILWRTVFSPFERATACRVMETITPDIPVQIRRQVLTGQVPWDLVALDAALVPTLAADGALDPIEPSPGNRDAIAPGLAPAGGVPILSDTLALAYRIEPHAGRSPATWADAWTASAGARAYSSPRTFPRDPIGLLEVANLADGVSLEALYPLDLDRAFRALDRLRPTVSFWWEKPGRPAQALALGEVDLAVARGGDLREAIAGGAAAALAPLPTPLLPVAWTIPRGAANRDIAHDLIAYTLQPPVQVALAGAGYLPAISTARERSTPPGGGAFPLDLAWWREHGRGATERFSAWVDR